MTRLITLTTDFGTSAPYVAAMKGVILSINPNARILDLTHEISPQSLRHCAFFLERSLTYFPQDSLHVVVVDPGVGTEREMLHVETRHGTLIVPDNGCWTWIEDVAVLRARRLIEPKYWRDSVSATFHGRDVFAPVAAHRSLGVAPEQFGPVATHWVTLPRSLPEVSENEIRGEVLFVDHFGNLITNVPGEHLSTRDWRICIDKTEITTTKRAYGEASVGELIALVSSSGYVEVAVVNGNASQRLNVREGARVTLK